jgi:hypothetical protein
MKRVARSMREDILNDLEQLAHSRIKGFKKYEKAGLYFEKHSLQSLWNSYLKYYNQNVAEYGDGYAADWQDDLKITILYKDGKIRELSPEWDEGNKKVSPDNIDSIIVDGSWGTAFAGPSITFRDETVYDDLIDIRADFV